MPEIETLYAILAGSMIGAPIGYLAAMLMVTAGQGTREEEAEIRPYGRDVD